MHYLLRVPPNSSRGSRNTRVIRGLRGRSHIAAVCALPSTCFLLLIFRSSSWGFVSFKAIAWFGFYVYFFLIGVGYMLRYLKGKYTVQAVREPSDSDFAHAMLCFGGSPVLLVNSCADDQVSSASEGRAGRSRSRVCSCKLARA